MSLMYKKSMAVLDKLVPKKLEPIWHHPAGPKTVFFWGPIVKAGLVVAGIGDLNRPAEKISIRQCASIAATGCIWARWCLVIIPKNYGLCCVNVFIALTQLYQLYRGVSYQQSVKSEEKNL